MASFFSMAELPVTNRIEFPVTQCGKCGLYKTCNTPKMPVSGCGKGKILVIAEAPGRDEDAEGIQLVGNSGSLLADTLDELGIDMRRDCWLDNALICRPPNNKIPKARMIDWCRPHIVETVRELEPEIIVPLGKVACESLFGWLWKGDDIGGIMRWVGFTIPDQKTNAWIVPNLHPAALLHTNNDKIYERMFVDALEKVAQLRKKGRPWNPVPDYRKEVELIYSPRQAAKWLKGIRSGDSIAFDYECLVPSTKVMTDDFKWVKIGDLRVGDRLTSFEETPKRRWRKLVKGRVTKIKRFMAPCVRITLTDGRVIEASENHPWLSKKGSRASTWIMSRDLKAGSLIRQVTNKTWETDNSRIGGWLAGFFDGEGYVTNKVTVGVTQVAGRLFDKALRILESRGFNFGSTEKKKCKLARQPQMMAYCKGLQKSLHFLGSVRPSRLVRNFQKSIFGKAALPKINPFAVVAKVEFIGKREVVGVTTDSGTYVAEGLCSHNTNMLKPDSKEAEIVCCSVSKFGKYTVAFPWHGKAIRQMKRILEDSTIKKVGWNAKFEHRWSSRFGIKVQGWVWDGQLAAHAIYNGGKGRGKVSGLKFQSYVHLGMPDYDSHLSQFLKSKGKGKGGGNEVNRIREIPLPDLLLYNGLDSLLEYKVSAIQKREVIRRNGDEEDEE